MGFGPQVVDLDGDGHRDMLTGSWPGELYLFHGDKEGAFGKPAKVEDKDGNVIKVGSASVAYATDWDRDGDLDLVVGTIEGHVNFIANESGDGTLAFGPATKLIVDGAQIKVAGGDSGPCVADWDGNGTLDLIVGCGDGSVLLYPNTARKGAPELESPVTLVAKSSIAMMGLKAEDPPACGTRSKVAVVDWNEDGRLDLLMGDFSTRKGKMPELSEEDTAEQKRMESELEAIQPKLMEQYKVLREQAEEKFGDLKEMTKEQRKAYVAWWTKETQENAELKALQQQMRDLSVKMAKYRAPRTYHGHVWLFQRKAAEAAEAPEVTEPPAEKGD